MAAAFVAYSRLVANVIVWLVVVGKMTPRRALAMALVAADMIIKDCHEADQRSEEADWRECRKTLALLYRLARVQERVQAAMRIEKVTKRGVKLCRFQNHD